MVVKEINFPVSMKQAAKLANTTEDTIRYYEQIGIIVPIKRAANGRKQFYENNIEQIQFIIQMRKAGLGITALKEYISLIMEDSESTIPQRKELLEKEGQKLLDNVDLICASYQLLQKKIENYQAHMEKNEVHFHQSK
ncbi:MerR family transcriptional regulator [Enterococcus hermanniensis]|uniref:MerR family transcriptional regulator n=1 Tax=Enterococcus hermanniensis TaxID=249189 RepID=A0A1L8TPL6_9ENTE|nr:MerR family transcriptional regulator [Enterococcus hermanniensis]OJG46256.1 MerR family transcriptional regulator [Enterococcus hermanniensis]